MKKQPIKQRLVEGKSDLVVMSQQVITAIAVIIVILYSGLEGDPSLLHLSTWLDMFYGFNSRYV